MYDHTKDGVDSVDSISCHHSVRIKSNELVFVLDAARINAKNILKINKVSLRNFKFMYQLGKSLVQQNIQGTFKNFRRSDMSSV